MRKQDHFHHNHLKCIEQQLGQQYVKTLIRRNKVQQCSPRLMNTGKNYINNSNSQLCTKYNQCMQSNHQSELQNSINDSSFTIPSQILKQEQYQDIQILPFTQTFKTKYQTQLIVNDNLLKKKKQKLHQIYLQRQQQQQRRIKLQKLKTKSKKKLQECPKRPLSQQKRPGWNHSIFGQKKQTDSKDKDRSKYQQSPKKETEKQKKTKLQPVKQRISKYLQKQKIKMRQIQQSQACKHIHTCPQKNLEQKKMEIQQSSRAILMKMKQQKRKLQQNRKIIKGKIRAIELQSRASLKKFKKKPVDPNIQFIVQILKPEKKKQKKQKTEQQKQEKVLKTKRNQRYKNDERENNKKSSKKIKQSEKIQKQNNPQNKILQNNEQQQEKKFYFWQIPIYKDDINKIDIDFKQTSRNIKPAVKKSSFRQEVDNYLNTKYHSKMQQYNQKQKQRRFAELVEEKKERFLQEYSQQSNDHGNFNEVFWNEEQLYKLSNIKNFN